MTLGWFALAVVDCIFAAKSGLSNLFQILDTSILNLKTLKIMAEANACCPTPATKAAGTASVVALFRLLECSSVLATSLL